MSRRPLLAALIGLTAALALLAAGCGGGGGGKKGGNAQALPASSCSDIYYEGDGTPDYVIASDLPLEGSGRAQTVQMTEAIKFILKQHNFKAGDYKIGYQSCDDATAQEGAWASEKCSANANAYAQNKSLIGVIGTFNSGCAEIIIPVLNRAPDGPVGMISPANTYVGLTHTGPGTAAGEPEKYYPDGKRNYIRIVAADDFQGAADENGGKLVKDLKSVLGNNVQLLAPDGFTPISAVVSGAGTASEGMYVSVAGEPNEKLGAKGKAFVKDFGATQSGGSVDPYSAYAAQSAEVLLTAIENSDGTRADVAAQLLKTKVTDGILGSFTIDSNGDTNSNPVTIYQIKGGKQTTYKTIVPPQDLVKGA